MQVGTHSSLNAMGLCKSLVSSYEGKYTPETVQDWGLGFRVLGFERRGNPKSIP